MDWPGGGERGAGGADAVAVGAVAAGDQVRDAFAAGARAAGLPGDDGQDRGGRRRPGGRSAHPGAAGRRGAAAGRSGDGRPAAAVRAAGRAAQRDRGPTRSGRNVAGRGRAAPRGRDGRGGPAPQRRAARERGTTAGRRTVGPGCRRQRTAGAARSGDRAVGTIGSIAELAPVQDLAAAPASPAPARPAPAEPVAETPSPVVAPTPVGRESLRPADVSRSVASREKSRGAAWRQRRPWPRPSIGWPRCSRPTAVGTPAGSVPAASRRSWDRIATALGPMPIPASRGSRSWPFWGPAIRSARAATSTRSGAGSTTWFAARPPTAACSARPTCTHRCIATRWRRSRWPRRWR